MSDSLDRNRTTVQHTSTQILPGLSTQNLAVGTIISSGSTHQLLGAATIGQAVNDAAANHTLTTVTDNHHNTLTAEEGGPASLNCNGHKLPLTAAKAEELLDKVQGAYSGTFMPNITGHAPVEHSPLAEFCPGTAVRAAAKPPTGRKI